MCNPIDIPIEEEGNIVLITIINPPLSLATCTKRNTILWLPCHDRRLIPLSNPRVASTKVSLGNLKDITTCIHRYRIFYLKNKRMVL